MSQMERYACYTRHMRLRKNYYLKNYQNYICLRKGYDLATKMCLRMGSVTKMCQKISCMRKM